ncbi:MAG: hypothetical protein B7Y12_05230 [Rhizobiales bacterium 24-66-13]|jgi:hypothetical protein|nr:MAG: hypothetical protein B7Y12_05230 [Rhizobiales bacterium 24-66-13]OZB11014.1 MAG: hypothetical protein B7X67_05725 [Rhizobiales bacterium 39-66-18]HQS47099.1 hypothetical protein [Xanthobacteraceae bacterium]
MDDSQRADTHPALLTPVLTPEIVRWSRASSKQPIVVYPEVERGNPANANCVVRYLLNTPGLLGGPVRFDEGDLLFAYSPQFAVGLGDVPLLRFPLVDTRIFHPEPARPRSGACFYASKYQLTHGQRVFGLPAGAVEITRDEPDSFAPEQIAEMFRSSEAFYAFENTALGNEAIACHCPTVLMPNPFLQKPRGLSQEDWHGIAWGTDPAEVERARTTVVQGADRYRTFANEVPDQIRRFIELTQSAAGRCAEPADIFLPQWAPVPVPVAPAKEIVRSIRAESDLSWRTAMRIAYEALRGALRSSWRRVRHLILAVFGGS